MRPCPLAFARTVDGVGRLSSLQSCMSLQLRVSSIPGIEAAGSMSGVAACASMTGSSIDGAAETLQRVLGTPEMEVLALRFDPMKKVIITAGNNKVIRVRGPVGSAGVAAWAARAVQPSRALDCTYARTCPQMHGQWTCLCVIHARW